MLHSQRRRRKGAAAGEGSKERASERRRRRRRKRPRESLYVIKTDTKCSQPAAKKFQNAVPGTKLFGLVVTQKRKQPGC